MSRDKVYAWVVVAAALAGIWFLPSDQEGPALISFVFWIALLVAIELLPVTLNFESQVTMGFPVLLAVSILFPPWAAMVVAGVGSFDPREFRRDIKVHHALFNRAQVMLSVAAASLIFEVTSADVAAPSAALVLSAALAAGAYTVTNLGLVAVWVGLRQKISVPRALLGLLPTPAAGFWFSYFILASLGVATAVVYENVSFGAWAVAAFIVPLVFARLSFLGAQSQQRLMQQVQEQQQRLLEATEQVLQEREAERNRIASHIHDSSLQLLSAAVYGCENALAHADAERPGEVVEAISTVRYALDEAITTLRASLVDLRKNIVEEGGLMTTLSNIADQLATLWGVTVTVQGSVSREPPVPIALGAIQIVQESLNNALKHAGVDHMSVRINDQDGMVHVVVEDEGAGFDIGQEIGEDHIGMRLMRDRADQLGGRVELHSRPGEGTRVEAFLPKGVEL